MQDHESVYGSRVASCIDTLHVLVSGILNCCAYFKRRFLATTCRLSHVSASGCVSVP